ncbi:signal recognition particle, SRP14 subunit [Scenedesmus sp. NREL 46B-D3]|nr:signal recognition particle, SRP14 subunit [Scenedesmus sp. NREL 46B-D3]
MYCKSADTFLNELHKLFERKKKSGSIWITMKRSNQKPVRKEGSSKKKKQTKMGSTPPPPAADAEAEYSCLIRATDGKRKISTAVAATDIVKFQTSYALILRAHMDSLKKREKSKPKKEAAAK